MRLLFCLLILTAPCWAQVIEFGVEPPDAEVYRVADNGSQTLLGLANRPVKLVRSDLPDAVVLLFRRPGWQDAMVQVRKRDLEGDHYPVRARAVCLNPGRTLSDRGHQFLYATSACLPWLGAIVLVTALLGVGQKAMARRQGHGAPRPLGSSK